jgi:molecular chaperone GrpE
MMADPNSPTQKPGARAPGDDPEATAVLPDDVFPPGATGLEAALAQANAKAEENFNQYVRALAELDNFRKRAARDLEAAHRYALERFAQELLPALDGFEFALANAAGAAREQLVEGQAATHRLLLKAFEKAGIGVLDPAPGAAFNPDEHEAVVAQPSAEQPAGTVLQTVQKGYVLNGRVLRPARVIVARAPGA